MDFKESLEIMKILQYIQSNKKNMCQNEAEEQCENCRIQFMLLVD